MPYGLPGHDSHDLRLISTWLRFFAFETAGHMATVETLIIAVHCGSLTKELCEPQGSLEAGEAATMLIRFDYPGYATRQQLVGREVRLTRRSALSIP